MKLLLPFLIFVTITSRAVAADMAVAPFSLGTLAAWNEKSFRGNTAYSVVQDEGKTVLRARSSKTASALIHEVKVEPRKYPLLKWSWKVEHSLKREDVARKQGDDFAARVYVIFPRPLFWRTRAITYVWAAHMPKNSTAPSPYTGNAIIVAVESGDEKSGKWIREERNVYEDYRRLFGEEPPPMGGIAVMTDTDDTFDEVTAWFGDIALRSSAAD